MREIKFILDTAVEIVGAIDYTIDVYKKLEPVITRFFDSFF